MPGEHDWMKRVGVGGSPWTPGAVPGQSGGFMDRLGGALFPGGDPTMQRQALLSLGLGLMAAGNKPGASFGSAAFDAFSNASQTHQGAMQNAFRNTLLTKQSEREERAEERAVKKEKRADREDASVTAGRLASGMSKAGDMPAYWQMVGGIPEVQGALQELGLQVPTELDPQSWGQFQQQLAQAGQIGGPVTSTTNVQSTFTGRNGNMWIVNRDGTVQDTGVAAQKYGLKGMDVGGGQVVFDPATGQVVRQLSTPEQEAAAAATMESAKTTAKQTATEKVKAIADFPRVEQNTIEAIAVLDQLSAHPGLPYITGLYSKAPIVPNTPQASADALAQQVQGQTFLRAYETLKGGGQITEVEGKKAEAAIARLSRAQSTKDYRSALAELKGVMNTGLERARKSASTGERPSRRIRVDAQGNVLGD